MLNQKIYFVIGASGSGKTTCLSSLESIQKDRYITLHFDSIEVPSLEQMKVEYGSPEKWQKEKTFEWVETIYKKFLPFKNVLFDAQTRPSFIQEACSNLNIQYEIILFHCNNSAREQRLMKRGNPELITEDMTNWSNYLKHECTLLNCQIIDTTADSIDDSKTKLIQYLNNSKARGKS